MNRTKNTSKKLAKKSTKRLRKGVGIEKTKSLLKIKWTDTL